MNSITWDKLTYSDSCPVCNTTNEAKIFTKFGYKKNEIRDMYICKICLCIFDKLTYQINHIKSDIKEETFTSTYKTNSESEAKNKLKKIENLSETITKNINKFNKNSKYIYEIGCGAGYLSYALAKKNLNKEVIAIDDRDLQFLEMEKYLGKISNLKFQKSIKNIKNSKNIENLVMWHVLEHIKNPSFFLLDIKDKISDNFFGIFQIPIFKKEHISNDHFIFYSPESINFLAKKINAEIKIIGFDINNQYLSFTLTRN
ncbi:methyltransferase [Prochlorococcus sp. AH-736-B04]|nr:methyltransferase [Prochlorococcus sp. AH-736-B04]